MKKFTILLLILAILPFASAGQIKHKFVATDESGNQLLFVDEVNPANDWTVSVPGNRDLQLSKNGTVLVTVDDGYREYALKDGKLVKEVKAGKGVRSIVRLDNGHTILAGTNAVVELDKNDKQVKDYGIKIGGSLRLLRLAKNGNFLYTSSRTTIKEVKQNAETVRELVLTKYDRQCNKPYFMEELDNGQFLITTGYGGTLLLVDKDWKLVKSFGGKGKMDGILAYYFADAQRLSNGNIVVANWTGHTRKDSQKGPQAIEFDNDGKVVWTWHDPKRAGTFHGIEIIEEKKTSVPKVLIIGDSISLGYTRPVAKMLKGEAVVLHSKGGRGVGSNAGATDRGIKYLDKYLGDEKWDVIHFNWGLWDLCYRHPDAKAYGKRDKVNGTVSIPLAQYEKNLELIVTRLKKTGAKLIWASTTKVPEGEAGRLVGDEIKYNRIAAKIMKKHGVVINDLHALTNSFDADMFTKPGDVHYKPEGSKKIADQVAAGILTIIGNDDEQLKSKSKKHRPNILIIFTDDQGYADLGCYGSPTNRTPRMDKLASEGTMFMDFYAQSVCGPSRSALLTGRNPSLSRGWLMPPEEITWAELIKGAGYQTACIGKWDVSNRKETIDRMPNAQGFDYYFGTLGANDNGRMKFHENNKQVGQTEDMSSITRLYTDKAIDYLENRRDKSKPFVLYVAHNMMHTIIDASEKFKGKSKGSLYGDVVEEFDYETGRLLDTVDKLGLRDNTLVIYTTDNGPWNQPKYTTRKKGHPEGSIFWGNAGVLRNGKGTCYEGGMRAPCIVRWPGKVVAGKKSKAIFSTLDFMPTFATLAGFKVPDDRIIDGVDQTGLLTGINPEGSRDIFFYEHMDWRRNNINGVRNGKWKYLKADHLVATYAQDESIDTSEQLYNLESDIGEKNNLAKKYPEKTRELKKMLDEYIASHTKK